MVAPDEHGLPNGYLRKRDADVFTLLRADGSVVARFSARGVNGPEVRLTDAVDAGIVRKPVRPRDG